MADKLLALLDALDWRAALVTGLALLVAVGSVLFNCAVDQEDPL